MNQSSFKGIPVVHAERLIPKNTFYCYTPLSDGFVDGVYRVKPCPFWDFDERNRDMAYCHYMKQGDLDNGGLLFDQVKECGMFLPSED